MCWSKYIFYGMIYNIDATVSRVTMYAAEYHTSHFSQYSHKSLGLSVYGECCMLVNGIYVVRERMGGGGFM